MSIVSHDIRIAAAREPDDALLLTAAPSSVNDGRRWVCDRVAALGATADVVDVVELLVSELLTNAVKYGPEHGTVVVTAERHGDVLDVAVSDDGERFPIVRHPGVDDLGGRGLLLVEALADQWGVELRACPGKAVWFHLSLAGSAA